MYPLFPHALFLRKDHSLSLVLYVAHMNNSLATIVFLRLFFMVPSKMMDRRFTELKMNFKEPFNLQCIYSM